MGWSSTISGKRTNNHRRSFPDKVEIRRNVAECVGAARVFDAFAGSGRMHRAVWHEAAHYVGCDLRWYMDGRLAYAADNRRVLRAIDLAQFNVFDFDAYGSPWECCLILAHRRRVAAGEVLGLCLTDGTGLALKLSSMPAALREMAGLQGEVSGIGQQRDDLANRALAGLAKRMNVAIVRRWEAKGHTGASVRYTGLVLRGLG